MCARVCVHACQSCVSAWIVFTWTGECDLVWCSGEVVTCCDEVWMRAVSCQTGWKQTPWWVFKKWPCTHSVRRRRVSALHPPQRGTGSKRLWDFFLQTHRMPVRVMMQTLWYFSLITAASAAAPSWNSLMCYMTAMLGRLFGYEPQQA